MRSLLPLVCAACLVACSDGAPGEPASPDPVAAGADHLLARYADNAAQVAIGGALVTGEIAFEPCEAPTIGAEGATLEFEGNAGAVEIELPEADLCGIRIVVFELRIEAEDDGVAKTVVGQDFDFWVPAEAVPTEGGLVLQLGGETWLQDFLPLAAEGTTLLNSEADADLAAAFYDGLDLDSSLDAQDTEN